MINVALRWKTYPNGTKSAYLDINRGKGLKRERKFIEVKIKKSDSDKKSKKALAQQIYSKYQEQLINNKYGIVSEDKSNSDFLNFAKSHIHANVKASKGKYIAALNKYITFLGNMKIITLIDGVNKDTKFQKYNLHNSHSFNNVTPGLCNSFKNYIYQDAGLKGESPHTYMSQFKALINRAVKDGYFLTSPMKDVKLDKPKREVDKDILTESEINRLFAIDYPHKEIVRAVAFSLQTGMPEKETKLVTYKDLKDGMLTINRSKSDEKVIIPLSESVKNAIGKYGKPNQKVFNLPSDTAIKKHINRWVKLAGIDKHITYYCFRHSFAVMLLNKGTNIKTVADLMGHTDISTTMKYLKHTDSLKNQAIKGLPIINI